MFIVLQNSKVRTPFRSAMFAMDQVNCASHWLFFLELAAEPTSHS
jgi:hypothetical protein